MIIFLLAIILLQEVHGGFSLFGYGHATTDRISERKGAHTYKQGDAVGDDRDGGCRWFGLAPFCFQSCPAGFDFIRKHSGRCEDGGTCPPDATFGEPCINLFGRQLTKKFCCRSDAVDCSWSGRWTGSQDAFNFYCRFDGSQGRCGRVDCSVNNAHFQTQNSSLVGGEHCDELFMWNLHGKATCGYIAWFDQQGKVANSWYKA